MASSSSSSSDPAKAKPPSVEVILGIYVVLGSLMSFLCGRPLGTVAEVDEVLPSTIVVCLFLISYSVYDVMGSGVAKAKADYIIYKDYKEWPARLPEEAYLAERAQMNQLEQMPNFLIGIMLFSFLVNGTVGAVLGLTWVILRRLYAAKYRASVGKKLADKGLGTFTIPCYFIVNTLLMAPVIHALRWIVATKM
ncbi:MAG: hypothetical protein SGILL_009695 [Bacillariaceae sp.]